ncbi:MAG: hypothetical protein M1483_04490 [Actinobacteria bacterium]|jgi:hypothetical protein|nr:hypothetical protein [Actinomycetota bacterium]MCL6104871.1 hypothetical protein [Actinomycetota bacterium]
MHLTIPPVELAVVVGSNLVVGFLFWAVVLCVGVLIEIAGIKHRAGFVSIGIFGKWLASHKPVRFLLIAGWAYAGWHLFLH